jgi:hypothetical protein
MSSICAKGTTFHDAKRSTLANGIPTMDTSTSTSTSTIRATSSANFTTLLPRVRKVYRSPFVTPDHPLYVFGGGPSQAPGRAHRWVEKPLRPLGQPTTTCLKLMQQLFLSQPVQPLPPQPFQMLEMANSFDAEEDAEQQFEEKLQPRLSRFQAQHHQHQEHQDLHQHQQQHKQNRVLRKSSTCGAERFCQMSVDPSLKHILSVIEGDLEGEDGLARQLRRMKRLLFLESVVATSSWPAPTRDSSHSQHCESDNNDDDEDVPTMANTIDPRNLFSATTTQKIKMLRHWNRLRASLVEEIPKPMDESMDGMEVVLVDLLDGVADTDNKDKDFQSFWSSSLPSNMVATEEDETMDSSTTTTSFVSAAAAATSKAAAPLHKELFGDSSVTSEATTACSTCEDEDLHWVSLFSISENVER